MKRSQPFLPQLLIVQIQPNVLELGQNEMESSSKPDSNGKTETIPDHKRKLSSEVEDNVAKRAKVDPGETLHRYICYLLPSLIE
jgi:hypothetical protein